MRSSAALALVMLVACSQNMASPPEVKLPDKWNTKTNAVEHSEKEINRNWWKAFNDENLNYLIEQAEANNSEYKIAIERIKEARADYKSISSGLYPQVNAYGKANRGDQGFMYGNKEMTLYEAGFDASWEIDFFGGTLKKVAAQDALIKSIEYDREAALQTLRAETARNYITYRSLQNQRKIVQDNLQALNEIKNLVETRAKAGLANEIELNQVDSQYQQLKAKVSDLVGMEVAALNRLSVIIGKKPGFLDERLFEIEPVPIVNDMVVLNNPSKIILQRPDIKSASETFIAATNLHEASLTDMFPKLSLSAFLGRQDTSNSSPATVWNLGGNLLAPLLNFGKIQGKIDAADSKKTQAFHQYRKLILLALEDVETSTSNYATSLKSEQLNRKGYESEKQAFELTNERYKRGIENYIKVMQSLANVYETATKLVQDREKIANNFVALNKSLGI